MPLLDNSTVYGLYKPLRNALRPLGLGDSLLVLWNYAQNYAFERKIDCTYQNLTVFGSKDKIHKARVLGEWEIETLVREVIVNSDERFTTGSKTLQNADYLLRCIGKLRAFENGINKLHSCKADPVNELRRMMHRQFPWQSNALPVDLFLRYSKIYKHPPLNQIFENHYEMTSQQFFTAAMAFTGAHLHTPSVDDPPKVIGIASLTPKVLNRFLSFVTLPLPELKRKLKEAQELSEDYAYTYNPLRAFPMIRMNWLGSPAFVCPIPVLLIWAVTQGIYYQLRSSKGFDHALGEGFEQYVGQVLEQASIQGRQYHQIKEEVFVPSKSEKRSVDWILADPAAALFIECKAKRLTQTAKQDLATLDRLNSDLSILAAAVVQVYKAIEQYRHGEYPSFLYDPKRRIYPFVVTMEDWYLMDPISKASLEQHVREGLETAGIPIDVLASMPYTVCSVQELERLAQILQAISIEEVMGKWSTNPEREDLFHSSYLYTNFAERCQYTTHLFLADFRCLFPDDLKIPTP